MTHHFDVIVVGVGAMGSTTCFELARRGVRVLGLDRFGIAHERGSSHGQSRMIRLAYYEHPDYVPLLKRAYENWRTLEEVSGQKLLHITGGLYAGRIGGELVARSAQSAREHGIDHEIIDRAEIARRYPQLALPDDFQALYEPMAGFLRPELAITCFARQAMLAGATIAANEPLRSWTCDESQPITASTDRAVYTADRIVFCGGSWSTRFLPLELLVTRQVMGWVWPTQPERFAIGRFVCWAVEQPDGSLYYGFPMRDDDIGLKVAHHKPGRAIDPDDAREPEPEDARLVERIIDSVLPAARGPIVSLQTCMYTNSRDSHFVIGTLAADPRVHFACGFSGHGFKFASVIGEIMADLATTGCTRWPIGFLSPSRFDLQSRRASG